MNYYPDNVGEKVFTNAEGFDWFIDVNLTDYARDKNIHGISLKNYTCYKVGKDGVLLDRVLVNDKNKPIYNNETYEGISVHIDMLKIHKQFGK